MVKAKNVSFNFNKDYILWTIIATFFLLSSEIGLWACFQHISKPEIQGMSWLVWVLMFFMILLLVILCCLQILVFKKIRKTEPGKKSTLAVSGVCCIFTFAHMLGAVIFSFWFIIKTSIWFQGYETANYDPTINICMALWISCAVLLVGGITTLVIHKHEKPTI